MIVTPITAGGTSAVASAARARNYLGIFNQSATATVYISLGSAAVAAATAGQFTLGPNNATSTAPTFIVWEVGTNVPSQSVNIIASAGATPVTLVE
jgi:hypothetical protein